MDTYTVYIMLRAILILLFLGIALKVLLLIAWLIFRKEK